MSDDELNKKDPFATAIAEAEEKNEDENQDPEEVLEVVSKPDLKSLVLDGKDAVIDREIEIFDIEELVKKIYPVKVMPITSKDRTDIEKAIQKKNSKYSMNQLLCLKGALDEDGMRLDISVIKSLPIGTVEAIADQIRFVS